MLRKAELFIVVCLSAILVGAVIAQEAENLRKHMSDEPVELAIE
jgi:hypothetical protein